jgi:hypothetical protein
VDEPFVAAEPLVDADEAGPTVGADLDDVEPEQADNVRAALRAARVSLETGEVRIFTLTFPARRLVPESFINPLQSNNHG